MTASSPRPSPPREERGNSRALLDHIVNEAQQRWSFTLSPKGEDRGEGITRFAQDHPAATIITECSQAGLSLHKMRLMQHDIVGKWRLTGMEQWDQEFID